MPLVLVPNVRTVSTTVTPQPHTLARLVLVVAVGLSACAFDTRGAGDGIGPAIDQPGNPHLRDKPDGGVDLLFVIDNSLNMLDAQERLVAQFPVFLSTLVAELGDLPSLHVGVVSTDLGVGDQTVIGCTAEGDGGRFATGDQQAAGCDGPTGAFIRHIQRNGGTETNYSGELSDAFSCIALLGTDGCGFEQPLEAMRKALDESNQSSRGFLRPDAALAVVFVTDEDDCSVADSILFDDSVPSVSVLGEMSSFRCFDYGVQCSPDNPRTAGAKTECQPRKDSPYMHGVSRYVDFLTNLKPPGWVVVGGLYGNPVNVRVAMGARLTPVLQPSCVGENILATPAVRLQAVADAFPRHTGSICEEFRGPLSGLALEIASRLK